MKELKPMVEAGLWQRQTGPAPPPPPNTADLSFLDPPPQRKLEPPTPLHPFVRSLEQMSGTVQALKGKVRQWRRDPQKESDTDEGSDDSEFLDGVDFGNG